MSLTSPEDIQAWFEAVQLYDAGQIQESIEKFYEVSLQNSRILFNLGCCFLSMNDSKTAAKKYALAVENDQHLAVGYFMRGLTSYINLKYESGMKHFEQAKVLLRGNKYLDYKQLGLNYQLYECEILANQAVMAYNIGNYNSAKDLLLQALDCKVEKKHDTIVEMLNLIQSGFPIIPFNPPRKQIFRPPKSYTDNLKKKNYLGKSKVLSTENPDEIYACFSGIKQDIIYNNNKPSPAKAKPLNRDTMLNEIRVPGRQNSLKKTSKKEAKSPPSDKVPSLPNRGDSEHTSIQLKSPPIEKVPSLPNSGDSDTSFEFSPSQPKSPPFEKVPSLPNKEVSDKSSDMSKLARPRSPCPPRSKLPPPPLINGITDETEINGNVPEKSLSSRSNRRTKSPKSPLAKLSHEHKTQSNRRHSLELSNASLDDTVLTKSLSNNLLVATGETKRRHTSVDPLDVELAMKAKAIAFQREISKGNFQGPAQNDETTKKKLQPENSTYSESNRSKKIKKKEKPESGSMEIEVQYRYIKKISLPKGCSAEDINEIIRSVSVPREIELCYVDDIGRQQKLTSKNYKDVMANTSKLYCFPAN